MPAFWNDVKHCLRLLRNTPVITCVVILSLALGIGANTAIFSVIDALMLRSLPVHDPQQIVSIGAVRPGNPNETVSLAMFQQIQKQASVFSNVFVWLRGGMANVEVNGIPSAGRVDEVSGDYFSALGVRPVLGRVFTHDDAPLDGRASARVAVISYRCWQLRYRDDPHVLGKTIRVAGVPFMIVGVSPPDFTGLNIEVEPEAAVPIGFTGSKLNYLTALRWRVFARLEPNTSLSQARAQLQVLWPGILKATAPDSFHGSQRSQFFAMRPDIQPVARGFAFLLRHKLERPLGILMVLVGAVLLIACVNLANLLVARASSRHHEFGIRVALGASRWRLIRMLLTEALLLSCAGATIGFLIAPWAARYLLRSFWTGFAPLAIDPSPDTRVFIFTAALAIFTGVLFGIAPAWKMTRSDPAKALSQSARTTGGRTGRLSRALIAAQVSLSLLLLIGATLFVRSLQNLQNANLGYHRDHLLIMQLFPQPGRQSLPNPPAYYHELATRLSELPGVESASYLDGGLATGREFKESVSARGTGTVTDAVEEAAGPGFFHMIGMQILAGREFDWRDDKRGPRVAIISESLAHALFPKRSAIGRIIDAGAGPQGRGLKIIGVVNSASLWKLQDRGPRAIYRPFLQAPLAMLPVCILRTRIDPLQVRHLAERTLKSLGHDYSLRIQTFEERADETLVLQRMIALLASGFSLLALLLAAIGLYGVISHAVTRRTAEIGIRMALGATRGAVLRMILGEVLLPIGIGIAIAIPVAVACGKLLSGMLFGVSAADPAVIMISCSILLAVAALAGFFPARRAARVDPMTALRYE